MVAVRRMLLVLFRQKLGQQLPILLVTVRIANLLLLSSLRIPYYATDLSGAAVTAIGD